MIAFRPVVVPQIRPVLDHRGEHQDLSGIAKMFGGKEGKEYLRPHPLQPDPGIQLAVALDGPIGAKFLPSDELLVFLQMRAPVADQFV